MVVFCGGGLGGGLGSLVLDWVEGVKDVVLKAGNGMLRFAQHDRVGGEGR